MIPIDVIPTVDCSAGTFYLMICERYNYNRGNTELSKGTIEQLQGLIHN